MSAVVAGAEAPARPVVGPAPWRASVPPGSPVEAVPLDGFLLLRDQVRGTFAFNATSLAGHGVGLGLIGFTYVGVAPPDLLYGWGGLFAAVWLGRLVLALSFARNEPGDVGGLARRLRWWQTGVVASGVLWGAAGWLFLGWGSATQQLSLIIVVYTYCVASVPVLAPRFRLFVLFIVCVCGPAIARIALRGDAANLELAVVMAISVSMTVLLGRNMRVASAKVIALKLRTQALAEQLGAEKAVADAARYEAEVANRAKTQFFAAASHDLRQPLHAMGLFAESLRARTREPEVAQLVNSINESVDALEGLFSELLDITRIDSGGVEVNAQAFEVGTIFRKLRLVFEPEAFEKGLRLRFRGGRQIAHADPLLVERILRNLVSNAIRYTSDGTVLASCRRRGGQLVLQVWDSGPGIGAEERSRVFEEFYQVPGAHAAGGEQKKGLGLGLAIVKRLAALMNAPLALRSEVGRGTVFTLELPKGASLPAPADRAAPAKAPAGLTLDGRLIVVVEDEPAVREGLEVLLDGWGAHVVAIESVAAARAWAAAAPAGQPAPSLVIADYRLEPGCTGVDAIVALRQRFGARLPALVVTGSSLTGHDKEAVEQDFHLLVKPVLPNKLRAMIAFKLSTPA